MYAVRFPSGLPRMPRTGYAKDGCQGWIYQGWMSRKDVGKDVKEGGKEGEKEEKKVIKDGHQGRVLRTDMNIHMVVMI